MIIKLLADILGVVIEMLMLSYFYRGLLGKSKYNRKYQILFYSLNGILAFVVSRYVHEASMRSFYSFFINLFPAILYSGTIWVKGLLALSFLVVQVGSEMVALGVLSTIKGVPSLSLDTHKTAFYAQGVLFSKFLAVCLIMIIFVICHGRQINGIRFLPIFFVMPLATILTLYQLAVATYVVQEIFMYQRFVLISFLLIIANLIQFVLLEHQIALKDLEQKMRLNDFQLKLQKEYYQHIEAQEQKTKSLKHDMNNLMQVILNLIEQNKLTEAVDSLKYLQKEVATTERINTGHTVVDAVLYVKQEACQSLNIVLKIDISEIIALIKVNPMDIVILLSNVLDNAIEATNQTTTQNKMIRCRIQVDEDHIIIYISNPVDKPVEITDGKYIMTTKADSSEHGLGLSNIRKVVEKYQGTLNLESTNDTFIFKAMLYNESEDNKA